MKITKNGTVTITDNNICISGFTFDCSGGSRIPFTECGAKLAALWAISRLTENLIDLEMEGDKIEVTN